MTKTNVLVTAVGGPTAIGILKGLKELKDINIVGTSLDVHVAGSIYCNEVYEVPKYTEVKNYVETIENIIEKENINIIFPTLQDEIEIYTNNEFNSHVALATSKFTEELLDKSKLYKHLIKNDLNAYVPQYYEFYNTKDLNNIEISIDLENSFVKDSSGHGGLGALRLVSYEHYINDLQKNKFNSVYWKNYLNTNITGKRLLMEFLEGEEYSIDVFSVNGVVKISVPRKRNRVSNGIVIEGELENHQKLISIVEKIVKSLEITGFFNLQFIVADDSYKLIDLNPRFCGSQVMSLLGGVNFPKINIDFLMKKELTIPSVNWNTKFIRYWESVSFND